LGGGVAAVAAVAGIELSGGIIANGDTITLGATTYTFVTTLDNSVANQVLINANLTNTCNSLMQAMYGYGNIGVDYSMATVPNATVWADGMLGSVQGFTAKNPGAAGNNIPISISSAGIDVFQPFKGGSDGVAATASLNLTSNLAAGDALSIGGTIYRLQAGAPAVYFQVQLGATAAETLQNLANAINGNTHDTSVTASRSGNTLNITESPAGVAAGSSGNGLRASGTLNATSPFSATAGSDAVTTASTDLNNTTNAQTALTAVSNAINIVSQTRGTIGANVNQLTAASNVMSCQTQNLQNAVNNLANADIGKTVANMTQSNVLQSTGMAALQETNQAQQAVLKLLQ
jgi:flagellin